MFIHCSIFNVHPILIGLPQPFQVFRISGDSFIILPPSLVRVKHYFYFFSKVFCAFRCFQETAYLFYHRQVSVSSFILKSFELFFIQSLSFFKLFVESQAAYLYYNRVLVMSTAFLHFSEYFVVKGFRGL